jgi:hypothetical protein
MPSLSRLNNCGSGKSVSRLLALLLALAIPAPLLLAGDDDHDRNNDREHGRFVDPIVGSWIIHVTVDTFSPTPKPPPPFKFDNIAAFTSDGITINSDPVTGTSYGIWEKMGGKYYTKIVGLNANGTTATVFGDGTALQGDQMSGPFHGFDTDATGKVIDQFSGTVTDNRITFQSTP